MAGAARGGDHHHRSRGDCDKFADARARAWWDDGRSDGAPAQAQSGAGSLHPRPSLPTFPSANRRGHARWRHLRVLDVGLRRRVAGRAPGATRRHTSPAIDPLPTNVEAARGARRGSGRRRSTTGAEPASKRWRGGAFDLVMASEVIEHVPECRRVLPALAAVAAPGRAGGALDTEPHPYQLRQGSRGRRVSPGLAAARHARLAPLPYPGRAGPICSGEGFRPFAIRGASYDGARDEFRLGRDPSVNYLLAAERR